MKKYNFSMQDLLLIDGEIKYEDDNLRLSLEDDRVIVSGRRFNLFMEVGKIPLSVKEFRISPLDLTWADMSGN